jgi:uroporphyrin-III C-methyltransferase/precorrin-2 dehydrogenase/sirohydrochlorin ferrochelatase
MAPLARLPVFLKLDGKRAIVAGGSPAAAWKAELLSAAGARIDVYAADPCAELVALAGAAPRGAIAIHPRPWTSSDCAGAAIAIGACDDDGEAARFAAAARAAGVPVNVIDKPAFCDFAFGAIVNRSPLVIGVSTDGAAPVFAQAIRARIETLIPQGFAHWAAAATQWRARVQALALSRGARLWFWEKFAARALANPDSTPGETDLHAVLASGHGATPGSVVLVGAGPGDPELLTLRAARALQSADVILFDQNIHAGILDFARREARKLLVRPSGADASKQTELEAMMIALAKAGRRVVRLTRGDPTNATGMEAEIAACGVAGIAVEVVPGIAAAYPSRGSQLYFPSSLPAAFRCDIRPATVPSSGLVAPHTRLQSGH